MERRGGEIGSFEGTSLDQSPWAFIPELGVPLETVQGAWTLNVSVDQFVWMHPNDPTKGMGVYVNADGMKCIDDAIWEADTIDPGTTPLKWKLGYGEASTSDICQ